MTYTDSIDMVVGVYGFSPRMEPQVATFLESLREKCNLDGVNVTCVEREHSPISDKLKQDISGYGFTLARCSIPPLSNCREDTSKFADWMVCNVSTAPFVIVAHFDVQFISDYIGYIRGLINDADMIGSHHDGLVGLRRSAYEDCQVGFCGIDGGRIVQNQHLAQVIPMDSPHASTKQQWLMALDVGELLAIRMTTLGMRHVWATKDGELGKSAHFWHARQGSDHSGGVPFPYPVFPTRATRISETGYGIPNIPQVIELNQTDIHLDIAGQCLCGLSGHQQRTNSIPIVTCGRCLTLANNFPDNGAHSWSR